MDALVTRGLNVLIQYAPYWAIDWYMTNFVVKTDHDLLGLRPNYGPSAQHIMVNDDFPNRVLSGLIKIAPDIKCFGPNSVTFVDGTKVEDLDAVILATGYVFGFPFLPESIVKVEKNEVDLYKLIFPVNLKHQTLAIIGCIQPVGAIMPISELQSRWVVQVFNNDLKLPAKAIQMKEVQERRAVMKARYTASQRHTIQVDGVVYMDEMATEVGCMPSIVKMWQDKEYRSVFFFNSSTIHPVFDKVVV